MSPRTLVICLGTRFSNIHYFLYKLVDDFGFTIFSPFHRSTIDESYTTKSLLYEYLAVLHTDENQQFILLQDVLCSLNNSLRVQGVLFFNPLTQMYDYERISSYARGYRIIYVVFSVHDKDYDGIKKYRICSVCCRIQMTTKLLCLYCINRLFNPRYSEKKMIHMYSRELKTCVLIANLRISSCEFYRINLCDREEYNIACLVDIISNFR